MKCRVSGISGPSLFVKAPVCRYPELYGLITSLQFFENFCSHNESELLFAGLLCTMDFQTIKEIYFKSSYLHEIFLNKQNYFIKETDTLSHIFV